jgi:hypothetical protein
MAEKKITKKERFEEIKSLIADRPELVEFIDHEIELIARKASKSAKPTPAQEDAMAIAEIIKDILVTVEDARGLTVGAMLKDERIKAYVRHNGEPPNSQVITAIVSKSADFVRTVEKKTAYYALNYGVVETEGV